MADSTSEAREIAADTDVETIIQRPSSPPVVPEAVQEAPVEPAASEGMSADDRIAALEKALQEMQAEREEAAKQALADKRSRILSDNGLTQEYAVLLDGDPGSWQQKAALLSSLRGGDGDKKPVSVPRDPIMNSDTMGATNNMEEQAAGFFGLS